MRILLSSADHWFPPETVPAHPQMRSLSFYLAYNPDDSESLKNVSGQYLPSCIHKNPSSLSHRSSAAVPEKRFLLFFSAAVPENSSELPDLLSVQCAVRLFADAAWMP